MDSVLTILGSIGFDPKLALFNLINFLLVFLVLKKLLFERIGSVITEREKKVKESLDKIKEAETALSQARSESEEIIAEAKRQGDRIIEQANIEAVELGEKIRQTAEEKIKDAELASLDRIKQKEENIKDELHEHAVELVIRATEKLLEAKIDPVKDAELITQTLSEIKQHENL